MEPVQHHSRWLRAIGYGVLAEIGTVITIILVVTIYKYGIARGLPPEAYDAFGQKAGAVIGIVGGTLFTYALARLLMQRLSANWPATVPEIHRRGTFIAHGIVVAAAAIVVSVLGSIAGHRGVPMGYVFASTLKVLAGWVAGFQAGKPATVT